MLLIKVVSVLGRINGQPTAQVGRNEFHGESCGQMIGKSWKVKDNSKNKAEAARRSAEAKKRKLELSKFTGTGKAK